MRLRPAIVAAFAVTLAPAATLPLPSWAAGVPEGQYRCEANGKHRMMMDFKVTAPGRYIDSGGKKGTFSLDAKTNKMRFRGGVLNGLDVDYTPGPASKIDVNSRHGSEAVSCIRAK